MKMMQAVGILIESLKKLEASADNNSPEMVELNARITLFRQINEQVYDMLGMADNINTHVKKASHIILNVSALLGLDAKTEKIKSILGLPPAEFAVRPATIIKNIEDTMNGTVKRIKELSDFPINNNRALELALCLKRYESSIGHDEAAIYDQFPGSILLRREAEKTVATIIETNGKTREELTTILHRAINSYLPTWLPEEEARLQVLIETFRAKIQNLLVAQPETDDLADHLKLVSNLLIDIRRNDLLSLREALNDLALLQPISEAVSHAYETANQEIEEIHLTLQRAKMQLEQNQSSSTDKIAKEIRELVASLPDVFYEKINLLKKAATAMEPVSKYLAQEIDPQDPSKKKASSAIKAAKPGSKLVLQRAQEAHQAMIAKANHEGMVQREKQIEAAIQANKAKIEKNYSGKADELELQLKTILKQLNDVITEVTSQISASVPTLPGAEIDELLANARLDLADKKEELARFEELTLPDYAPYQQEFNLKAVDLAPSKSALEEIQAKTNILNVILNKDPAAYPHIDLYHEINKFRTYGEELLPKDREIGQATIDLAQVLTLKANCYMAQPELYKEQAAQDAFKDDFKRILHSRDEIMSQHRGYKRLVTNLLLALSVFGLVLIAAKLAITSLTENKASFFFGRTNREHQLNKIEEILDKPAPAPAA